MKNKILLCLCVPLLLVGCSSNKKVNIDSWEFELKSLQNEDDASKKFNHYSNVVSILNEIEYEKDKLSKKLDSKDHDGKSSYYQDLYWKVKTDLYDSMKEILKNNETKSFFIEKIGENTVSKYINTDTSEFFYSQELEDYDCSVIEDKFNSVSKAYENGETIEKIREKFIYFYAELDKVFKIYQKSFLLSCLDNNDEEANEICTTSEASSLAYENKYYELLQKLLKDEKYKNDVAQVFDLSQSEIDKICDVSIYSEKVNELMNEEARINGSINASTSIDEMKDKYVQLVNVRQQIAKELNYDNYLEYVYKELYNRDYSVQDGLSLCNNLLNNNSIKSLYMKLGYSNYLNKAYYDSNYLNKFSVSESDLWKAINKTNNVLPNANELANYIKENGLYNFETRSNKASMSFVTSYTPLNTYYMFIGATSTVSDYTTCIHEFGHYYGFKYLNESKATSNTNSLDLAEINSQGLEYLMTNYYSTFLNSKLTRQLTNMQIFNALWVIESSICISELEYYVYTKENITKGDIDRAFVNYFQFTTYPFSFSTDDGGMPTYVNVTHLYQQPGYYISYLTSLIAALEIYSLPLQKGVEVYNELVEYGPFGEFKDILNRVGLSSPFENDTIKNIANKLNDVVE